jgi:hypothetical protein
MGTPTLILALRRSPQSSGVSRRPLGRAATLEVCLAMLESEIERKEFFLSHRVPSPE